MPAYQIYQAFGIGGWNNEKNDGEELTGHLHASPHALGLTAIHHPAKARDGWTYLVQMEVLSPLNVVESLFLASENGEPSVVANSLKSGWNLLLQTLGWTRTIAGADYAAHKAAQQNEFIANGFSRLMHAPWQNPQNRFDVNGKDGVTPLDVLIVIAVINARPADVSVPAGVAPAVLRCQWQWRVFAARRAHGDPTAKLATANWGRRRKHQPSDVTFLRWVASNAGQSRRRSPFRRKFPRERAHLLDARITSATHRQGVPCGAIE